MTAASATIPTPTFTLDELQAKVMPRPAKRSRRKKHSFQKTRVRSRDAAQVWPTRLTKARGSLFSATAEAAAMRLHMAVECMHPIIQKRPPLPAIALTTDVATLTAIGNDLDFSMAYAAQLHVLARPGDIAMGFSTSGKSSNVNRALQAARQLKMFTVGFAGRDGGKMPEFCDFCFVVRSFSIPRIQETQETLLHIVWDLIHVIRGEEDVL